MKLSDGSPRLGGPHGNGPWSRASNSALHREASTKPRITTMCHIAKCAPGAGQWSEQKIGLFTLHILITNTTVLRPPSPDNSRTKMSF